MTGEDTAPRVSSSSVRRMDSWTSLPISTLPSSPTALSSPHTPAAPTTPRSRSGTLFNNITPPARRLIPGG